MIQESSVNTKEDIWDRGRTPTERFCDPEGNSENHCQYNLHSGGYQIPGGQQSHQVFTIE